MVVDQALQRLRLARFQDVAEYRGFRNAVASLMEEVEREALGTSQLDRHPYSLRHPDSLQRDLARIYDEVERELTSRGRALRNARLRAAAESGAKLPPRIILDGFFAFSSAELTLIESLAARIQLVVTLPASGTDTRELLDSSGWPGAEAARTRLLAAGFRERRCTGVFSSPAIQIFCAATLERETEEIARRILDEAARGRPLRDMGIVLRTRDPYTPALATTLARFGIPARFYFASALAAHPAIDFLAGTARALLHGWDHAELLRLLRMPVSGVGATPDGDRFDFELRKLIPGRGLPFRASDKLPSAPPIESLLSSFASMNGWMRDRIEPAEWASRIKTLRALIPAPETGSLQPLDIWTSTARALDAFDALAEEVAASLGGAAATLGKAPEVARPERIALHQFWAHVEAALELTELRVPDRRRDVVHIFDVFEARQWALPVIFVCGMNERHFPQYHREDPLLNDAARWRANLKTSTDLQQEERSLFQLAITRATERTILSYSLFDDKGDPTLPSFFIDGIAGHTNAVPCETRVRPRPSRAIPPLENAPVRDGELLGRIAAAHRTLSPTSIERFLQCPFQFFADKSLRLRRRPPAPRDRLDLLAQGSIMHAAIAGLEEMPLLGAAIFDEVFAAEGAKLRIPGGYRTEAVRLEMLRNFTAFLGDHHPSLGWPARVEEKFNFPLTPGLNLRGRIDRLEVGPRREALVIDYKYSVAKTIHDRVKHQDKGEVVQAGLYLLAAVKEFGLRPAGMLYCGLKKEVEWDGWHLPLPGLEEIGESCTRDRLDELTHAAAATAARVFDSIASGEIAVRPADQTKCAWCDYRDICRVETRRILTT
jgi:ATP-dependent helicase/DNAse subunit B